MKPPKMFASLFAAAALGMLLGLPLMLWPTLAFRASDVLRRAGNGEGQGRAWLLALLALCGMFVGLFLGHH